MLSTSSCAYIVVYIAHIAFCALQFQQPEDLPAIDYDFIIAGGGTAGVVVASRLSENHDLNVLIIEAGPSNDDVFESQVPGLSHSIRFGTRVDWNYTTVPQVHVNGSVIMYPRAMMLGGCSSHNGMVYTRGSRDDYDRWASIVDDDSFYGTKYSQKWSGPNDPSLPEQGHFDPSMHNFHGEVGVSAAYGSHPFNDLLFEVTKDARRGFPFLLDQNDGRPIGISWGQFTVSNGARRSSATGYLPHTGNNLHVLLNTRVTRILPADHNPDHNEDPDFRTVEFATSAKGSRHLLTAIKEVIVSGGAVNTPQILLNSGIGSRDDLKILGINATVDNPSVGQNFTEQLSIAINFTTNLPVTDVQDETTALREWTASRTGPLALPLPFGPFAWVRLTDDAGVFEGGSPDPTAGPNSPHIEFEFFGISPQNDLTGIAKPGLVGGQGGSNSLRTTVVNLHPFSRGSVTLNSSSPFSPPLIDMNLLGSPLDEPILIEGVLSALRLFALPGISKNIFGLTTPTPTSGTTPTREEISEFIESHAVDFGHAVGSCSMAPRGAKWGVVDPDFRVKGARGLRVVDASVIPYVTSGHTQAPVYAMAELASDVIKRAWE